MTTRRGFLKALGAAAASLGLPALGIAERPSEAPAPDGYPEIELASQWEAPSGDDNYSLTTGTNGDTSGQWYFVTARYDADVWTLGVADELGKSTYLIDWATWSFSPARQLSAGKKRQ